MLLLLFYAVWSLSFRASSCRRPFTSLGLTFTASMAIMLETQLHPWTWLWMWQEMHIIQWCLTDGICHAHSPGWTSGVALRMSKPTMSTCWHCASHIWHQTLQGLGLACSAVRSSESSVGASLVLPALVVSSLRSRGKDLIRFTVDMHSEKRDLLPGLDCPLSKSWGLSPTRLPFYGGQGAAPACH